MNEPMHMVFTTDTFLGTSYKKLAWVEFEPMATDFRSDAAADWDIRPWV